MSKSPATAQKQQPQFSPATQSDSTITHLNARFPKAPRGANLGFFWHDSRGTKAAYKKDWITGHIRPRTMMDDFIDKMTPEKREAYRRKLWRPNHDSWDDFDYSFEDWDSGYESGQR